MSLGPSYIGNALEGVATDAIVVHSERCTKVRNRNTKCMKCAAACTSGCISYEDNELKIDLTKCVGCGTCATVCPTCALEAHNPSDTELLAVCRQAVFEDDSCKKLVFGCSQATEALGELIDASLVAQVVCAGRVDESILCELAASGVSDIEILCGACEACAQKHGLDTANLVVETTCELFAAWNVDCTVSVVQTPPSAILSDGITQDLAEGVLAGYFADGCECEPILSAQQATEQNEESLKSDDNAASEGEKRVRERDDDTHGTGMRFYWESTHSRHVHKNLHVMKDGTLPHFLPERRNRVLNALSAFGEPEVRGIETRLMGTVAIDVAKCVSCRMCAVFCPTGAIAKFDEPDGTVGINHMPADCIKCESCKDICPAQAIVINDEVSTGYILEGRTHRYVMDGRDVSLRDNPHQMLETMRKNIPGDIFER